MPTRGAPKWIEKGVSLKRILQQTKTKLVRRVQSPTGPFDFITQTLDKKLYKLPSRQQFLVTYRDMISLLNYICSAYCVVAEVTKQGNIHYHFWAQYKQGFEYSNYADTIKHNRRFGFSYLSKPHINKSYDSQKADMLNYIFKDLEKTYKYVRSLDIVYTQDLDLDNDQEDKDELLLNEAYNLNLI